jgi:hypothetical protein
MTIDAAMLRKTIEELTVKRNTFQASAQAAQGGIETCEYLLSLLDKVGTGDEAIQVGPGTEIMPGYTVDGDLEPI